MAQINECDRGKVRVLLEGMSQTSHNRRVGQEQESGLCRVCLAFWGRPGAMSWDGRDGAVAFLKRAGLLPGSCSRLLLDDSPGAVGLAAMVEVRIKRPCPPGSGYHWFGLDWACHAAVPALWRTGPWAN